jgi:hypothetical protein
MRLFLLILLLSANLCFGGISISNCPDSDPKSWINCNGTASYASGTYTGDFVNGHPSGEGRFLSNNGDDYEGNFINGCYEGIGKLTYPNGDMFEGTFKQCKKHGEVILTRANGARYQNTYNFDRLISTIELQGETTPEAISFTPSPEAEKMRLASVEREKQMIQKEEKIKKTQVELKYSNGTKYVGQVQNNLPHGQGIFYGKDTIYEGEFKLGKFNGRGTLDGTNSKCEGTFKENQLEGKASCLYRPGRATYEGDFKQGLRSGNGLMVYENGDIYDGEWNDGLMHGVGTYKFLNSRSFTCNWVKDRCPAEDKRKELKQKEDAKVIACFNKCTSPQATLACMQRYNMNSDICGRLASSCAQACGAYR